MGILSKASNKVHCNHMGYHTEHSEEEDNAWSLYQSNRKIKTYKLSLRNFLSSAISAALCDMVVDSQSPSLQPGASSSKLKSVLRSGRPPLPVPCRVCRSGRPVDALRISSLRQLRVVLGQGSGQRRDVHHRHIRLAPSRKAGHLSRAKVVALDGYRVES
jgi:hypothetical protein